MSYTGRKKRSTESITSEKKKSEKKGKQLIQENENERQNSRGKALLKSRQHVGRFNSFK